MRAWGEGCIEPLEGRKGRRGHAEGVGEGLGEGLAGGAGDGGVQPHQPVLHLDLGGPAGRPLGGGAIGEGGTNPIPMPAGAASPPPQRPLGIFIADLWGGWGGIGGSGKVGRGETIDPAAGGSRWCG